MFSLLLTVYTNANKSFKQIKNYILKPSEDDVMKYGCFDFL